MPPSPAPPLAGLLGAVLVDVPPPDALAPPEPVVPEEPEPEPEEVEPDEPVPDEPDEPVPDEPEEPEPEEPAPDEPEEVEPEAPEPEAPEPAAPGDEDVEDPDAGVLPVVVVALLVVAVDAAALGAAEVGTVSCGAPDVSAADDPPPPHADTPAASASPEPRAANALRSRGLPRIAFLLGCERGHPPGAVRAIVEVLLGELVAPVAKPQVLDRPGKLGCRRGQRQELCHYIEPLAGLAVDVIPAGLGLDHDFPPRRGCPQAVLLADPHARAC
ncbi:MAG: hypothetical protein M3Y17_09035 [Actinomycetota bacterium]|nr:hypothetical protein [Actinomycetota bacterium]